MNPMNPQCFLVSSQHRSRAWHIGGQQAAGHLYGRVRSLTFRRLPLGKLILAMISHFFLPHLPGEDL
jgi:hypothetical protein